MAVPRHFSTEGGGDDFLDFVQQDGARPVPRPRRPPDSSPHLIVGNSLRAEPLMVDVRQSGSFSISLSGVE